MTLKVNSAESLLSNYVSLVNAFDALEKTIDERTTKPKYPTGIHELDDLIWGLHKKELLVIGARPSHGKTSLSLQIAWNLAKNDTSVVFNSLEMSKENIIERITCNEFEINGFDLRKGIPASVQKFKKYAGQMRAKLLASKFEIVGSYGRSSQETEDILKTFKPQVMVIDHAQKISSLGFKSKYEALSSFVNDIQDMAIEYDCAMVLNSQINRGGEFLKGAGELEESADTLIFCEWEHRTNPEVPTMDYKIETMKQRHGPCSSAKIAFVAPFYKFRSQPVHFVKTGDSFFGQKAKTSFHQSTKD